LVEGPDVEGACANVGDALHMKSRLHVIPVIVHGSEGVSHIIDCHKDLTCCTKSWLPC